MTIIFNESDVIPKSYMEHFENQYMIIKPEALKADFRNAKNQLFYAVSGFGCDPNKMGSAVFGAFCCDGESTRMERNDFIGIATEAAIEEWKQIYGEPNLGNKEEEE